MSQLLCIADASVMMQRSRFLSTLIRDRKDDVASIRQPEVIGRKFRQRFELERGGERGWARAGERLKRNGYKFVPPSLDRSHAEVANRVFRFTYLLPCSEPAPHAFLSSVAWHPGGQPATPATQRAVVALDYCLVQRWTYLGAFKGKRTFSSLPGIGGREGRKELGAERGGRAGSLHGGEEGAQYQEGRG